ncbi:unnamed protein product [Adineta ricciae]|uniref:F-box domain-containing protein n=1 Tax=Adineta ricciae TaxID=249248 RepID=A0A816FP47_ADIRI|nr:unnamed protein product [Adineta ricciae]
MESIEHCRTDNFHSVNDGKRQSTQINNHISQFEDLSNEVIYEVFEYLDYYHVYQGFFNLNYRFHSLQMESILPIKINLFPMSQSTFNRYNHDIIIPNTHRIDTLRISSYFMFDNRIIALSEKTFLRTLIIENIESKYLKNLLHQLTSLLNLTSLTISTIKPVNNDKASIYQQIFQLPSLKFCKISTGVNKDLNDILPCTMNNFSPIEHLVFDERIEWYQLSNFLSYIPYLRYLKVSLKNDRSFELANLSPCLMKNLTHVSLRLYDNMTFIELEELFVNYFPFVQVLYLSPGIQFLNANEWERIISLYLPNLRIFNVYFFITVGYDTNLDLIDEQIKQFQSSFWIDRQFFLDYRFLSAIEYYHYRILYSTNPYRYFYFY